MAEETGTGGAAEAAKDEVDVLKAAIGFLAIVLVGLGGVLYFLVRQRDGLRAAVEYGEKNLKATAAQYDSVRGLIKQYKDSGADEARRETASWLKGRYSAAGIQDSQVSTTGKWDDRPAKEYVENSVDVTVKNLRREQAVHFLWNVERMSPKMRTIEMTLRRTAPPTAPESDVWELKASFGYRVPRGFREGG